MTPEISVITTVYNCEDYLATSVRSILEQTFRNFEYIIVDDGSSDRTPEIIREAALADNRIVAITNERNLGRVKSLNAALERARGTYIAIQDADDISLPDRLKLQYEFLENNRGYVLVGADITVIDEHGKELSQPVRPEKNEEVKFSLLFRCTFANPSIMFVKETADRNGIRYEEDFQHCEDFRIISRISSHGKVHNLPEKLIMYRKHESNNSKVNSRLMNRGSSVIARDNLLSLGFKISDEQAHRVRRLISSKGITQDHLLEDVKLLFDVIRKFREQYGRERNREIEKILKRMTGWLGKKNVISRPDFTSLYVSILTYYYKEIIFGKDITVKS